MNTPPGQGIPEQLNRSDSSMVDEYKQGGEVSWKEISSDSSMVDEYNGY